MMKYYDKGKNGFQTGLKLICVRTFEPYNQAVTKFPI